MCCCDPWQRINFVKKPTEDLCLLAAMSRGITAGFILGI
jgi:hypothetical protein